MPLSRFTCTRCGRCCTGDPGTVRVTDDEIETLAALLDLERDEFLAHYTRTLRGGEVSLVEKRNNDCVFWDRTSGCEIYPVRPRQCRTFPFWEEHLQTPESWDVLAQMCPGVGCGRKYDKDEILARAEKP